MNRQHVLLALVVLIIVAVFMVSVAVGSDDDRADPNDAGGIEAIDDLLGSLPGFGTALESDDVSATCFAAGRFEVAAFPDGCAAQVPEGIDVIRLGRIEGQCRVRIVDQPGVFDQSFSTSEWTRNRDDLSLTGDGALLTIGFGPCVLALNPE